MTRAEPSQASSPGQTGRPELGLPSSCRGSWWDADYVGFDCPDYFVVGYGMDVAHAFRELPFVGIVKGDA